MCLFGASTSVGASQLSGEGVVFAGARAPNDEGSKVNLFDACGTGYCLKRQVQDWDLSFEQPLLGFLHFPTFPWPGLKPILCRGWICVWGNRTRISGPTLGSGKAGMRMAPFGITDLGATSLFFLSRKPPNTLGEMAFEKNDD